MKCVLIATILGLFHLSLSQVTEREDLSRKSGSDFKSVTAESNENDSKRRFLNQPDNLNSNLEENIPKVTESAFLTNDLRKTTENLHVESNENNSKRLLNQLDLKNNLEENIPKVTESAFLNNDLKITTENLPDNVKPDNLLLPSSVTTNTPTEMNKMTQTPHVVGETSPNVVERPSTDEENCLPERLAIEWKKYHRLFGTDCISREAYLKIYLAFIDAYADFYKRFGEILFERADVNKDGVVEASELEPYTSLFLEREEVRKRMFRKFLWKNGTNNKKTFARGIVKARKWNQGFLWDRMNVKEDTCVDQEEFTRNYCPYMLRVSDFYFKVYDANDDGILTKAEYDKFEDNFLTPTIKTEIRWNIVDVKRTNSITKENMREFAKLMFFIL